MSRSRAPNPLPLTETSRPNGTHRLRTYTFAPGTGAACDLPITSRYVSPPIATIAASPAPTLRLACADVLSTRPPPRIGKLLGYGCRG